MNKLTNVVLLVCACGIVQATDSVAVGGEAPDSLASTMDSRTPHVLDGWAIGGAYSIVSLGSDSDSEDTLRGPSLCIVRHNPTGIGLDMAFTYVVPTGFYDFTGLSVDIAITFAVPLTVSTLALAKAGGVAFVGGNSDGGGGGNAAFYPGIGIAQRLLGPLTITAEADIRFWVGYGGWQSFGGRLGLLLKL